MTKLLEGKTSKEYIESLKAYLADHDTTHRASVKAQDPANAIRKTGNITSETIRHIQEDLALYFANFATEYGARQYEVGMVDLAMFQVKVKTLCQCGVLSIYNNAILVSIFQLVRSCPPTCPIDLPDAMELIRTYVF